MAPSNLLFTVTSITIFLVITVYALTDEPEGYHEALITPLKEKVMTEPWLYTFYQVAGQEEDGLIWKYREKDTKAFKFAGIEHSLLNHHFKDVHVASEFKITIKDGEITVKPGNTKVVEFKKRTFPHYAVETSEQSRRAVVTSVPQVPNAEAEGELTRKTSFRFVQTQVWVQLPKEKYDELFKSEVV